MSFFLVKPTFDNKLSNWHNLLAEGRRAPVVADINNVILLKDTVCYTLSHTEDPNMCDDELVNVTVRCKVCSSCSLFQPTRQHGMKKKKLQNIVGRLRSTKMLLPYPLLITPVKVSLFEVINYVILILNVLENIGGPKVSLFEVIYYVILILNVSENIGGPKV